MSIATNISELAAKPVKLDNLESDIELLVSHAQKNPTKCPNIYSIIITCTLRLRQKTNHSFYTHNYINHSNKLPLLVVET